MKFPLTLNKFQLKGSYDVVGADFQVVMSSGDHDDVAPLLADAEKLIEMANYGALTKKTQWQEENCKKVCGAECVGKCGRGK